MWERMVLTLHVLVHLDGSVCSCQSLRMGGVEWEQRTGNDVFDGDETEDGGDEAADLLEALLEVFARNGVGAYAMAMRKTAEMAILFLRVVASFKICNQLSVYTIIDLFSLKKAKETNR